MTMREESGAFPCQDRRLAYRVYGEGTRVTVLLHGLLLSQRMHEPLARALAERGNRVVTLDLLGHGRSDRPPEMWRYSMGLFAQEVVGLLDHLGVDEAVVGGTSLGANTTLEVASLAPERLRGMVVEMPVLDNALLACAVAFTPLLVALTVGEPVMKAVSRLARLVPERRVPWAANVLLDTVRQDPAAERRRPAGPVLGPHGAAPLRAAHVRRPDARDRAPPRPRASVLRRGAAGRGAAERHAAGGELDPRAAPRARAPDGRDRELHRAVLAPPQHEPGAQARRARVTLR